MKIIDAAKIFKSPKGQSPFKKSENIQEEFARALRGVAKEVWKLIESYEPKDILSTERLVKSLRAYAEILDPWAKYTSRKFLEMTNRQDLATWDKWLANSRTMGSSLRDQIRSTPMGDTFNDLMRSQVTLIKSIPLEAAERVRNLVTENLAQSARADEIAKKIFETNNITKNRANTIARTEVSRASANLLQTRAVGVGSDGYIWRTSGDLIVRKSHREMNGKFVEWTKPPMLDKMTGHAGCLPNCRCWADPILPD